MVKKKSSNKSTKELVAVMEAKSLSSDNQFPQQAKDNQKVEETEEISTPTKALFQTYDVPPDEFIEKSNESEEEQFQTRKRLIYARSIESSIGYSSLLRTLSNAYIEQVAYYRSIEGGALPIEEARARSYRPCENEEEAHRLFDHIMSIPVNWINMSDLLSLIGYAPCTAENVWEMMKREAQNEVESGHLASKALTPIHQMQEAWNTACFLGLRESLAAEWQPRGGIELNLIDMMAQAFLQYQYWTEQVVLRSQTEPRTEAYEYVQWKSHQREVKTESWKHGHWDIPYVSEQDALEHAAQMVDRWNRIYMRTLRNLRDLRRYSVPVTINNPQQVNIAANGGQQVNVSKES